MREYELMVVLSPELDEAALEAAGQRIKAMLDARGAEVKSVDPWGKRRLAYPIRHFREAHYTLARFNMAPEQCDDVDRELKLTEQVLRHLLVRLDSH